MFSSVRIQDSILIQNNQLLVVNYFILITLLVHPRETQHQKATANRSITAKQQEAYCSAIDMLQVYLFFLIEAFCKRQKYSVCQRETLWKKERGNQCKHYINSIAKPQAPPWKYIVPSAYSEVS